MLNCNSVKSGEISGSYRFFNLSRLFMFGTDSVGVKYNKIFAHLLYNIDLFPRWGAFCLNFSSLVTTNSYDYVFAVDHSFNFAFLADNVTFLLCG